MRGQKERRCAWVLLVAVSMMVVAGCSDDEPGAEVLSEAHATSSTTTIASTTTTTTTTVLATTTTVGPAECMARAPLFRVVGQLVLATATEEATAGLVGDVVRGHIGGIVLVEDATGEVAEALAPLAEAWPPPIIAVDEEGGTVQRLAAILGEQPSARDLADSGDPNMTRAAGVARGAGAAELGFTMVLAPVLDIGKSSGSVSRAYGDDVDTVVAFGLAYAEGLTEGGVVAVAKHFPGHGSTDADSHRVLPSTPDLDSMRELDLLPFEMAAASLPAVMTGHLAVPDLTDGAPATLSAAAIALLRNEIGFEGLVITDDLSMGALSRWSVPEAAELAIVAGNDLLIAGGHEDAIESADRLAEAVAGGRLDRQRVDEAAMRVLSVKGLEPCEVWSAGTG